ncbi:MAG: Ig-like domain-containing protein [Bryobacterales bacterium]|nr:Ig-like domain-containing protein [Bryobacterales bacterium]
MRLFAVPPAAALALLSFFPLLASAAPQILILQGNGQVLREGEFAKEDQTYPQRTRIRVLDWAGNPAAYTPVTWTVPLFKGRWFDGTVASETSMTTLTDANGEASNAYVAPYNVGLGNSFQQTTATVSAAGATAPLHFTTVAFQVDGFPNPFPMATRLSPEGDPPSITGRIGQTITAAIRYKFTVSSRLQGGMPLPNIGLSASTGNTTQSGPVVECVQSYIVLSDDQGVATCDLKISGKPGSANIRLNLGGGYTIGNEPYIGLVAQAGEISRVTILSGNNQAGDPNQSLATPLMVSVDDGVGNTFSNVPVTWSVTQGAATINSPNTNTDFLGRAFTTVRLGPQPGTVLVRATATGGTSPSATFSLQVNAQGVTLSRVSGDNQSAALGAAFAQPIRVRALTSNQAPLAGLTVNFAVTSGAAGLSATSALTDSNGYAQVSAAAGNLPGTVRISASIPASTAAPLVFTLTVLSSSSSDSRAPQILFRDSFYSVGILDLSSNMTFNGGGVVESSPVGAQNAAGDTHLVARDFGGALWLRTLYASRTWSDWVFLGGQFVGVPAIAVNNAGTALILGHDRWGAYWAIQYTPGSALPPWTFLGGVFGSDPSVAPSGSGFALVGRDTFGTPWLGSFTPGPSPIFSWQSLGGTIQGKPSIAVGLNGIVVVARDPSNGVWAYRRAGIAASWSFLGAAAGTDPQVVGNGSATTYITILDPSNVLWYAPVGGAWVSTSGVLGDYASLFHSGKLVLAGRDFSGGVWHHIPGSLPWTFLGLNGVLATAPQPAAY